MIQKCNENILVYVQCHKRSVHPASLQMIGEAYRLVKRRGKGGIVHAVAIGECAQEIREQLRGQPISMLYFYDAADMFDSVAYEQLLVECIHEVQPSVLLLAGTPEGRSLAPRIAVAFKTGLTADCTELDMDDEGSLIQIRPAFGGDVMARILTPFARPQIATVRPNVMKETECLTQDPPPWIYHVKNKLKTGITLVRTEPLLMQQSLADQRLLVVAGRGVQKKGDLEMLRELAELLHGALACTRALVEKGFLGADCQIGLSGNTVSPEYMITCGVSGSIQFMAGMKMTRNIIAINNDENANIFRFAHYPVCGDLYEVVPELISLVKEKKDEICI